MKTVSYELAKEMLDTLQYAEGCLGTDGNDPVDLMISKAKAAMAEPQPDADGWIKWEWGECPVSCGTLVEVKLRSGRVTLRAPAGYRSWCHYGDFADIIAYRIAEDD